MNYNLLFVILLSFSMESLIEISQAHEVASESDDNTSIRDILNDHQDRIGPIKTLALLKKLYNATHEQNLSELIQLADINEARCDKFVWLKMLDRVYSREDYSNVELFVLSCLRRQFINCLPKFEKDFRSAVESLSAEDRKRLELLDDIFIKHYQPKIEARSRIYSNVIQNIHSLGSGLLQLDSRIKSKIARKLQANLFTDESIIKKQLKSLYKLCDRVSENLDLYSATQPFLRANVFGSLYPQYVLDWLPRYRFCDNIDLNRPKSPEEKEKLFGVIMKDYFKGKQ